MTDQSLRCEICEIPIDRPPASAPDGVLFCADCWEIEREWIDT